MFHRPKVFALPLALLGLWGCATAPDAPPVPQVSERLETFESRKALDRWLEGQEEEERLRRAAAAEACEAGLDFCDDVVVVTASKRSSGPNITNVQTAGVDEGDIAKLVGQHLVFLQDGRLFSVSVAGDAPDLVDRVDVYDRADEDVWIDELLVSGSTLVVTGYHYGKGATEIALFRLTPSGRIRPEGKWYVGSDDYFSSDNSASRLIGETLVFHTPMDLRRDMDWPTLWGADRRVRTSLIAAQDIYLPVQPLRWPSLHMVTQCDLAPVSRGQSLDCRSRGVIAPGRAEWVVSETDGFLWVEPDRDFRADPCDTAQSPSTLYRFPLDSDAVDAVFVQGEIPDRFAVEPREDRLYALTEPSRKRLRNRCETPGSLALLDLPLGLFSAQPQPVSPAYLTKVPGDPDRSLETRFTADKLIYAQNVGNWSDLKSIATVVDLAMPTQAARINLPHGARRVDRIGANAFVVGLSGPNREDVALSLSWLDLAAVPDLTDTLTLPGRRESEGRAQALNMRVEADGSALIGLPTRSGEAYDSWDDELSSDISFMQADALGRLVDAGTVRGDASRTDPSYECETSCVDWYGNARPFFIGNRIFALIASELVEAELRGGTIVERSRLNLSAPLR